jgi:CRP-like cAMP-binding protein
MTSTSKKPTAKQPSTPISQKPTEPVRRTQRPVWTAHSDLSIALGASAAQHSLGLLHQHAEFLRCARGQRIYSAGDPNGHWFRVVSGFAKEYAQLPDGRVQILALLQAEDWFGQSLEEEEHRFTVEAVSQDTLIARYDRMRMFTALRGEPTARETMLGLLFQSLSRAHRQVLVLGRTSAPQRVATFLLELKPAQGRPHHIALPLSRYEIADLLVLSVETVSRTLTRFRRKGWLRLVDARRIEIVDRAALEALADNPLPDRDPQDA